MPSFVDLNRANFLKPGVSDRLNYLSAHYKNIRFQVPASIRYRVKANANSPGIAFEVYGDRNYWWVICQYAGIINPISEIKPGLVIDLPSLADVNAFLTSINETSVGTTVTI